ncbi:MAG: tRNA (guanosine(46)-N7)-methyltransferase TrmB [Alphaproteobacteria bacterium]|nr:tRNA (guanosine(46)-N7)-methyltransferase TrmB [Alphaproteobacteria bacterium]
MTHPPLRSYGRIKARTLKPRQAALLETLLPKLALPADGPIDLDALFSGAPGGARDVVLEIGFGGGEHLVAQASAHPGTGFIGVEPFLNGVASCLRHIEEAGVQNVRLHQGDARDLLARLPDARLNRVDILFPDPWPKQRHWKRRLIQRDVVWAFARVLKPGGEVRFATDWAHYAGWTMEMFHTEPQLRWLAERPVDWRRPWPGHAPTRYEEKRLGDIAPIFLRFERAKGA